MAHPLHTPAILLVKTSSLGDVLHNLPVVSDIVQHYPDAQIDWMVEESFAALPRLHPAVRNIIPVALRRWRGKLLQANTWREIAQFRARLAAQRYDFAIDTQGLVKSAVLMRSASGLRCGYDKSSAREPLAANFYQRTFSVSTLPHAVQRNRQLVAQALNYSLEGMANYAIRPPLINSPAWLSDDPYIVLLHATSRADKLWDEAHWIALGDYLHHAGIRCVLPWGSALEKARSQRLAAAIPNAIWPPQLNLNEMTALLAKAHAVIGVDTGLNHLAAALNIPTIGIYTATDPGLTGLHAAGMAINLGNIGRAPQLSEVIDALQQLAPC